MPLHRAKGSAPHTQSPNSHPHVASPADSPLPPPARKTHPPPRPPCIRPSHSRSNPASPSFLKSTRCARSTALYRRAPSVCASAPELRSRPPNPPNPTRALAATQRSPQRPPHPRRPRHPRRNRRQRPKPLTGNFHSHARQLRRQRERSLLRRFLRSDLHPKYREQRARRQSSTSQRARHKTRRVHHPPRIKRRVPMHPWREPNRRYQEREPFHRPQFHHQPPATGISDMPYPVHTPPIVVQRLRA